LEPEVKTTPILLAAVLAVGCTRLESDIIGQYSKGVCALTDTLAIPDTVTVASYNMSIGYEVESLIASDLDNDTVAWHQAHRILDQYLASLPVERVQAMAKSIRASCPDLVGLQETERLWVSRGRSDVPALPFLDSLLSYLAQNATPDCPARYAAIASPLNATSRHAAPADSVRYPALDLSFEEGNAILYRADDWSVSGDTQATLFSDYLQTSILGQMMPSARALQQASFLHVRGGRRVPYQVWNTHLEVLRGVRENQSAELANIASSNCDRTLHPGQILMGDLNDSAGSRTMNNLTQSWQDMWVLGRGTGEGLTCCASDGRLAVVTSPTGGKSRRIDYVLSQGADTAWGLDHPLDSAVTTPTGAVFPSDHNMVLGRLRFRIPAR
jgi:endonuclease/exonuclease/phosphatase family metal-dependent hydrolase